MATIRTQRAYDHRLRDLVRATRDVALATSLGVPRSTAAGWLRGDRTPVVAVADAAVPEPALVAEVARLRRRVQRLRALLCVALAVMRVFGIDLARRRVPEGEGRRLLLRAIDRAREILPLGRVLRAAGLSPSRYHAWRRPAPACQLDDRGSCPKSSPHRLTAEEIRRVREMVTSSDYRHVPTGTLARLAQRAGRVFASASTWYRLVRDRGWRRPRACVYPQRPTEGIRATRPNDTWHVDTTIIRLLDGTRTYLHAVIDNFGRRILAWRLAERFEPANAVVVLLEAGKGRGPRRRPDRPRRQGRREPERRRGRAHRVGAAAPRACADGTPPVELDDRGLVGKA